MRGTQEKQKLEFAQDAIAHIGTKKRCTKCNEYKYLYEFCKKKGGKDGRYSICKICDASIQRLYQKLNMEIVALSDKKYYKKNRKRISKRHKQYCLKNKERISANKKRYFQENKEKIYKYRKSIEDEKYKLNHSMRTRMGHSLKNGNKNGSPWESLVGYSLEQLKRHLEKQFKPGMSWENYGRGGWHIDHKIPVSVFNINSIKDDDFKRCWSLDNLQPLWAIDNIKKSNKIKKHFQPMLSLPLPPGDFNDQLRGMK